MTAPDGDQQVNIEVELDDALSKEAIVASKSAEEMAREVRTLNRQLLLLDKRALKAATSVGVLDAVMEKYSGRVKGLGGDMGKLDDVTERYAGTSEKVEKRTKKLGNTVDRTSRRVRRFSHDFNILNKILDTGGKGLRPRTLLYISLGTAIAGAIGPAFQLGAALSYLAGFLVAVPAAIDVLLISFAALAVAFKGVGEGISAALSGDWQEFYDAQKDLAPSAQHFLKVLRKFRNEYKDIRKAVQEAFFAPFTNKFQPFLRRILPIFKKGFTEIGKVAGETVGQVFDFFAGDLGASSIETLLGNTRNFWEEIRDVATPIMAGFAKLVNNTAGSFDHMTDIIIGKWGNQFANWLDTISQGGEKSKANAWLEGAIAFGGQLLEIFQSVGRILLDISKAAGGASYSPLQNVLNLIEGFTSSREGQEALTQFFESMRAVMAALGPVVIELGSAIGTQLVPILEDIIVALAPFVTTAIDAIGDALETTRPAWGLLAEAVGQLLVALAPLLPPLAQIILFLGTYLARVAMALAPILETLLTNALTPLSVIIEVLGGVLERQAPFMEQIFTKLGEIFTDLTPVITEIAKLIGDKLVEVFETLFPVYEQLIPLALELLEVFGKEYIEIIKALIPILPPLIDLLIAVLKLLASKPTIDLITMLVKVLIWLTQVAFTILVPVLKFVVMVLGWVIDRITNVVDAITWLREKIWEGLTAIYDAFVYLKDNGGRIWDSWVEGLKNAIKAGVNFIIDQMNRLVRSTNSLIDGINRVNPFSDIPHIPEIPNWREQGGPVAAGQLYGVGEAGKEMYVPTGGGAPTMVGEHGTEFHRFGQDGFIVPNRMVKAMERANDGLAAELNRMEASYESSADRAAERAMAAVGAAAAGGDSYHVEQHFHGANLTPRDVEREVRKALKKIEQDKRERS